ncbi:MAG: hypothetical protein H0X24_15185 [Ktedonobacterales bacterium]|nr:hypothetical protein [Ktedonobacterales bacterium]
MGEAPDNEEMWERATQRSDALPPVPLTSPNYSRPLPQAYSDVARDVLATHDADPASKRALPKPMIITGNGHVSHLRPSLGGGHRRSRTMRLSLAAVLAGLLLVSLFVVTPLTVGASGRSGSFLANVGLAALPSATPTVTPTPDPYFGNHRVPDPGKAVIVAKVRAVFGPYSDAALRIVACESQFNTNNYNPISILGSHAEGIFQILYPSTWYGTAYRNYSPYDWNYNIPAAYQIFKSDGYTWREWECQP